MTAADIALIVGELGPIIKAYVEQATVPLVMRNKELELRLLDVETRPEPRLERGERGEPGQKGDIGISVASLMLSADQRLIAHYSDGRTQDIGPAPVGVPGEKGDRGERGEMGLNGKDASPVDLSAVVAAVLAQLPAPVPGEKGEPGSVGPQGLPGAIGPQGPAGEPGPAGVAGVMGPQGEKGADGVNGTDGLIGPQGEKGADGLGITDALIDRRGHLVLTMSDGRTKDIGGVVGANGVDGTPGAPGADGRSVDLSEVQALISKELATWPRPKDGIDGKDGTPGLHGKDGRDGIDGKDGSPGLHGKDGRDGLDGKDGLGIDDMDLVFDEEKGYVFRLTNGDRVKEHAVPWPWDAKVWEAGRQYLKAAGVTWDGHLWIAQRDTTEQPGEGSSAWRLAVRRGKQGREGKPGKDAPVPRTTNTPPLYGY